MTIDFEEVDLIIFLNTIVERSNYKCGLLIYDMINKPMEAIKLMCRKANDFYKL